MSKTTVYLAMTIDSDGDCDGAASTNQDDAISAAQERHSENIGGTGPTRTVFVAVTLELPKFEDAGEIEIKDGEPTVQVFPAE